MDTNPAPTHRGRIVVGVDGSPASLLALGRAIDMATTFDMLLEVVTAWTYPPQFGVLPPLTTRTHEDDADDVLRAAAERFFPGGLPEWVSLVTRQGFAANVLIAESQGADMLVVGSRGHGAVSALLLGSVSSECAERASCPVLVMR